MQQLYELVTLANGTHSVRSLREGETFHPVAGPIAEGEALYVRQLRLEERMLAHHGEFVIWDVGLGSAANVCTALRSTANLTTPLHIVSFDKTLAALEFALAHASDLQFLAGFETPLSELLNQRETVFDLCGRSVRWRVQVGDIPTQLNAWNHSTDRTTNDIPIPHAIFFDAFSPAKNPEMWTLSLFQNLRSLIPPQHRCSFATFSRSTLARAAILLGGFYIGAGTAVAGKEETTIAATHPELVPQLLGREWLERARRSQAAEPMRAGHYVRTPLAEETWAALCAHPQFN